jgi:endonuclease G
VKRRTTPATKSTKAGAVLPVFALTAVLASVWCGAAPRHASEEPAGAPSETRGLTRSADPTFEKERAAEHRRRVLASLARSPHVALGVPTDADPADDVLLDEQAFVVSYNPKRHGPNWVAWQLDRSHLGVVHRQDDFRADSMLPSPCYQVQPKDYAGSGYERGHMCPSGDRTRDAQYNSSTFLMTNMLPQVHELNDGPWKKLEEYERTLANEPEAALYIVAGGIFADAQPTIGPGVSVPLANYKIIVVLRAGQAASDVVADTKVVAAIMPNDATAGAHAWTDFFTSVDEIESRTGYDFLSRVDEPVQRVIEASVADQRDDRKRRRRGNEERRQREGG